MMHDDSDSDCSLITEDSSNESIVESLSDNYEVAKILDQKFHLPKDLCENADIFKELLSLDTLNQLTEDDKASLNHLLPHFPDDNDGEEQNKSIQLLFENKLSRFGQTPIDKFHNNLQDGNYRPDIAYYRRSILRAEQREQRIRECERVSLLAEKLVLSRERLLKATMKSSPADYPSFIDKPLPELSSCTAAMRANRRYFKEILKLSEDMGMSLSDDEKIPPEACLLQLSKKQIKQFNEQESLNTQSEVRICCTTSRKENKWDHIASQMITEDKYKQLLKNYRKRKAMEPENPDFDIDNIDLKDVIIRSQVNFKKSLTSKVKQESLISSIKTSNSSPSTKLFTSKTPSNVKTLNRISDPCRINIQERPIKSFGSSYETDEEDWIKANIIKIEPNDDSQIQKNDSGKPKHIFASQSGVINRKRPISGSTSFERLSKKVILDATTRNPYNDNQQNKVRKIMNNPTRMRQSNDLSELGDDESYEVLKSPESTNETQACFLSLIRDIFCSTPDHRMKLEELRKRINVWLKNPVASTNDWFNLAENWASLLISSVYFLSGEFINQPDDFVPYLEFKSQLNIYQWIGAGRDSNVRMKSLCQYWLSRREEMGIRANNSIKYKVINKTIISPEKNEENHLTHAISPPSSRCRTDWKVQAATDEEIRLFRIQERQRYENPHLPFTYRHHGYESVVAPLKGIYSQAPGLSKARDHNTLIAERPNFVTILALVRDATARLPNGEGTRWDICELLKSSQYLVPNISDATIQSIVSGALDRMHTEQDPSVKYDTKRKLWIYVHRNRTEQDFERSHQQQQDSLKKKPTVVRKFKTTESPVSSSQIISSTPMRIVSTGNISNIRPYQPKLVTTSKQFTPSLNAFENNQRFQAQSSPPPLKISPKRFIKTSANDKALEPFDIEASLDAHTTPIILKTADNKVGRLPLKTMPQISPIRTVTSSPACQLQSSSPVFSGIQSIVINHNQSTSPKFSTVIGNKKIIGKPIVINQTQAPPLISHSSTMTTSQGYVIPINMNIKGGTKIIKPSAEPPVLSSQSPINQQVMQRNILKVNIEGKNVISPLQQQQPKIVLASSHLQLQNKQKGGKVIATIPRNQSPITSVLSQQKQILTNVLVQQQKAKGQSSLLLTSAGQQKLPALTMSAQSDGKVSTTASLTPHQRQTIVQSLKQFNKQGVSGTNQTMIVKPQIIKTSTTSSNEAPPLVSVSGSIGKVMKPGGQVTLAQQSLQTSSSMKVATSNMPLVTGKVLTTASGQVVTFDGILSKPGTTFKIAGAKTVSGSVGQSGLIQIGGSCGSQITQYAVVSKGKNIISVGNQPRFITTQANITNNTKLSETTIATTQIVTSVNNTSAIQQIATSQSQTCLQQNQPIKIVQNAQQLINAKLINVQGLTSKGLKTTGGIKMISPQNYITNLAGKPLIITGKSNASGITSGGQSIVLQAGGSSNGTSFILNSQGQPLKVQGSFLTQGNVINQPVISQGQTVMLGNQIVKVQSLNQMQKINTSGSGNTMVLSTGGQAIKVQTSNANAIIATKDGQRSAGQPIILGSTLKVLKPQQQGSRVVLAAGTQPGQFTQQIILPPNFQGIKTLQGIKVIPSGHQGFATRLLTSSNTKSDDSNLPSHKPTSSSSLPSTRTPEEGNG